MYIIIIRIYIIHSTSCISFNRASQNNQENIFFYIKNILMIRLNLENHNILTKWENKYKKRIYRKIIIYNLRHYNFFKQKIFCEKSSCIGKNLNV